MPSPKTPRASRQTPRILLPISRKDTVAGNVTGDLARPAAGEAHQTIRATTIASPAETMIGTSESITRRVRPAISFPRVVVLIKSSSPRWREPKFISIRIATCITTTTTTTITLAARETTVTTSDIATASASTIRGDIGTEIWTGRQSSSQAGSASQPFASAPMPSTGSARAHENTHVFEPYAWKREPLQSTACD